MPAPQPKDPLARDLLAALRKIMALDTADCERHVAKADAIACEAVTRAELAIEDGEPDLLRALRKTQQHVEQLAAMVNVLSPGKVRVADFTEEARATLAKAEARP